MSTLFCTRLPPRLLSARVSSGEPRACARGVRSPPATARRFSFSPPPRTRWCRSGQRARRARGGSGRPRRRRSPGRSGSRGCATDSRRSRRMPGTRGFPVQSCSRTPSDASHSQWFRLREVADSGRSRVRERRGGFLSLRERRTRDCFKTRRTRHRGTTVPGGVRGLSHLVLSSVAHRWTFRELSELEWDPAPSHARARFRAFLDSADFRSQVQRPVRAPGRPRAGRATGGPRLNTHRKSLWRAPGRWRRRGAQ